jgi:predicted metal-dependent phosphoesterase TrpH
LRVLFDLHVHTTISQCSILTLDEILSYAGQRGLDGVCITDHQSLAARNLIKEGIQPNGLRIFIGMEYHTIDGDFLIFGNLPNLSDGLDARQLLDIVARVGGGAIAAHPFRHNNSVSDSIIREDYCHIVESFNGRNNEWENMQVTRWCESYNLVECAGSDAHTVEELGKFKTRFSIPINSTDDLVFALNNGLCAPEPPLGAHEADRPTMEIPSTAA